ncbi:hypothetical protein K402DRAFT_426864 [Aulographum hederae CBS 113979]|uniref:Uncharacterized protein n=1 Tax=Aulographum hederae CBS 113979 TaxID=1176131 RepID=A0A6G1H7D5_9PEZI|nr:hypothetical protein K402DRAFT_426864 [Aulographum hederae CBS 113979]
MASTHVRSMNHRKRQESPHPIKMPEIPTPRGRKQEQITQRPSIPRRSSSLSKTRTTSQRDELEPSRAAYTGPPFLVGRHDSRLFEPLKSSIKVKPRDIILESTGSTLYNSLLAEVQAPVDASLVERRLEDARYRTPEIQTRELSSVSKTARELVKGVSVCSPEQASTPDLDKHLQNTEIHESRAKAVTPVSLDGSPRHFPEPQTPRRISAYRRRRMEEKGQIPPPRPSTYKPQEQPCLTSRQESKAALDHARQKAIQHHAYLEQRVPIIREPIRKRAREKSGGTEETDETYAKARTHQDEKTTSPSPQSSPTAVNNTPRRSVSTTTSEWGGSTIAVVEANHLLPVALLAASFRDRFINQHLRQTLEAIPTSSRKDLLAKAILGIPPSSPVSATASPKTPAVPSLHTSPNQPRPSPYSPSHDLAFQSIKRQPSLCSPFWKDLLDLIPGAQEIDSLAKPLPPQAQSYLEAVWLTATEYEDTPDAWRNLTTGRVDAKYCHYLAAKLAGEGTGLVDKRLVLGSVERNRWRRKKQQRVRNLPKIKTGAEITELRIKRVRFAGLDEDAKRRKSWCEKFWCAVLRVMRELG